MISKTFYTMGEIFGVSLISVIILATIISLLINSFDKMKNSVMHKILFTIELILLGAAIVYGLFIIVS